MILYNIRSILSFVIGMPIQIRSWSHNDSSIESFDFGLLILEVALLQFGLLFGLESLEVGDVCLRCTALTHVINWFYYYFFLNIYMSDNNTASKDGPMSFVKIANDYILK